MPNPLIPPQKSAPNKDWLLAATYKVLKTINDGWSAVKTKKESSDFLDAVREMVGQDAGELDGVNYQEMRQFIADFTNRHRLGT